MPRYRYECTACGEVVLVFHSLKEVLTDCKLCSDPNTMKKLLSRPLVAKKQGPEDKKTGDITKEYIEKNRQVLKQQKKEAKEKTHDTS